MLYPLAELLAAIVGQLVAVFLSLPPPLQVGLAVAAGYAWTYRRGWNNAVDADYVADIRKATETRNARRK